MRGVWRAATRAANMVGGGEVEIGAWNGSGRYGAMTALRCGVSESSSFRCGLGVFVPFARLRWP